MHVINAEGRKLGRMCSEAVGKAMAGEKVRIVNSEKAIITGKKEGIIERYKTRFNIKDIGNPRKSPKMVSRRPDLFIKKTIKGMIPQEKKKGKKAQKRIKAHIEVPEELSDKVPDPKEIKTSASYSTVGTICRELGWSG